MAQVVAVIASTAIRGFTLSSSASRHPRTASRRCSTPSGVSRAASARTSAAASGCAGRTAAPHWASSTSR